MASPSLLAQQAEPYAGDKVSDRWCRQVYAQHGAWLMQLDAAPAPLHHWLARNQSPLLGRYFESLLAFWVRQLPDCELLAQNLIVERLGRHSGEFDLLWRDPAGQMIHWEAAVKFYLRYDRHELQWLGPNPRDSLRGKLNKLFTRQLHLHRQPAARRLLQARFGTAQIKPRAFVKGYLFYPYHGDWRAPQIAPAGVSRTHLRGWWCRHAEMRERVSHSSRFDARWCVLSRLQRLSPAYRPDTVGSMTAAELLNYLDAHFAQHFQAVLIAELDACEQGWCETSRGFVVNPHWPDGEARTAAQA
ncbi:hypothetical protein Tel_01475 [Candidatus Tenderia electrophaga]|jgi:hypothetical protein|uniref:DUF1853 family protein n=1 Tax=Candidatus Tenderia electrophaga TaxID=1748243 RepID=A0A0S2T9W0_9GAMM|nr:hypothetical protein Tel_01475 [Candidatus Tenderia electrophaga]